MMTSHGGIHGLYKILLRLCKTLRAISYWFNFFTITTKSVFNSFDSITIDKG